MGLGTSASSFNDYSADILLQQADLGTARRENISTFDDRKNIPSVGLEDIEASRQSNIIGTAAQRLASKNKPKLTAWSGMCSGRHPLTGGFD